MNLKRSKHCRIPKGLEHGTVELRRQVNLSRGAVPEPKPEDETADVPSLDDVIGHHAYSNGSIRASG